MTKIRSLTIVNGPLTHSYYVGQIYNNLLLNKIEDKSVEFIDSLHIIYTGFTSCGEKVFDAIVENVPVDYEPAIKDL